ncbi:MAG: hypothetical protein O7F71_09405 [Gammaproteobacteria bacterium]|nr:hypothetical protein [Gammaproteobacteria bacterium]
MSWSLFAIIQLGVTAAGIVAAFWLRNRELKKHLNTLETAQDEAGQALAEAKTKLESIEERKAWLKGRIAALDGDDPVTIVQRMVLQNESKSEKSFNHDLSARLAGHSNVEETWRELRANQNELSTKLIGTLPSQHSSIVKLYEVYSALDVSLGIDLPALPEAEEGSGDLADDDQLRSENARLQEELESARGALAGGEDAKGDLKSLLQQFTRDSRDMMLCIEMLEAENLQLRERLKATKSAESETPSEPDETSSEVSEEEEPVDSTGEDVTEIDDADIEAILASVANEGAEDAA